MPFQQDLEHAWKRWQAEEENARRLAHRARIVSTVILAVLGALLVQTLAAIGADTLPRGSVDRGVGVPLALGVIALLVALGFVFHPLRKGGVVSMESGLLTIPRAERAWREILMERLVDAGAQVDLRYRDSVADRFRRQEAQAVRNAAVALRADNEAEALRLRWAQVGLLFLAMAGGIWAYTV